MNASFSCTLIAQNIQLLALDVDGILSDGQLLFGNSGEEIKAFNVKDGFGMKLLQSTGIKIAIITGRTSALVDKRMTSLGVDYTVQGREDKGSALLEACAALNILPANTAYMGDDWPDLSAFAVAGLKLTVANAHSEIKKRADYISNLSGGTGAVRDVCDMLMQAQGSYAEALERYLAPTGVKSATLNQS